MSKNENDLHSSTICTLIPHCHQRNLSFSSAGLAGLTIPTVVICFFFFNAERSWGRTSMQMRQQPWAPCTRLLPSVRPLRSNLSWSVMQLYFPFRSVPVILLRNTSVTEMVIKENQWVKGNCPFKYLIKICIFSSI